MDEVERLVQALEHRDWKACGQAAEALAKTRDARAMEPLCEVLKVGLAALLYGESKSYTTYALRRAARALGEIGDPEAVGMLCVFVNRGLVGVDIGELEALVKIGAPAAEPLCKELGRSGAPDQVAAALVKIGIPAVEPLCRLLGDEDARSRSRAADALCDFGSARVAEALEKTDGACLVEPLRKALEDENVVVRGVAAFALGHTSDARAVEPLCRLLEDRDERVREQAAESLGKIGDWRAVEPLCRTLKDENVSVRRQAAEALGNLGLPGVLPALRECLRGRNQERDEVVLTTIREAIAKVERATAETKSLPRPADTPMHKVDTLPRPAGAPTFDVGKLPRVAEETKETEGR